MIDNRNNIDPKRSKEDLKGWMDSHPQEYGEVALEMGEADLLETFLIGQAAFIASPEFQKRLEDMVDTDTVNIGELVEILHKSGFTEKILTNPNGDEDWEKYRLPFAAWLKYGRSSEMVIENIEDAIALSDNRQAKWQLSKFLKDVMKRLVESKQRSRKDLGEYINYRKCLECGNIAEWALSGIGDVEEATLSPIKPTKKEKFIEDLSALIVTHDQDIVNRIGDWLKYNVCGIDVARLYVALIETDEIKANLTVTRFMDALKTSFPEVKIVGTRQVQKDVNTLQSLLPHGKRYGKDEPENRFAIDKIKTEVLMKNPETLNGSTRHSVRLIRSGVR
ncbi:MAG: hypothetical protein K2K98_06785, partial [Muribaculaceae bacterium]|nr:hypothetical protein [Muribaculaceae bacterium]